MGSSDNPLATAAQLSRQLLVSSAHRSCRQTFMKHAYTSICSVVLSVWKPAFTWRASLTVRMRAVRWVESCSVVYTATEVRGNIKSMKCQNCHDMAPSATCPSVALPVVQCFTPTWRASNSTTLAYDRCVELLNCRSGTHEL
jgi:hypothetical protein